MHGFKRSAFTTPLLACLALGGLAISGAGPAFAVVLQTQMGIQGEMEADVIKAKVDGNVLTVAVMFRNTSGKRQARSVKLGDIYFIDAAGKKKYLVLRDAKKKYIAAPLDYSGRELKLDVASGGKQVIWMKFPAPPADSATINLSLPVALPFDGLKVQR